ncbi:MAG: MFS transporter, partial [Sphingomonadales bacterium]|nr:MFS transporter [Sphingomonadales bacterium]
LQVGLGFLVLVYGATFAGEDAQVALIWLVLAYLLHTTGELCLSPVGLSMITKLSVAKLVGLMMGIWFFASSLAHYVAGLIAASMSTETVGGQVLDTAGSLATYSQVFQQIGIIGILAGVVVIFISPFLRKGMHDVH